MTVHLRQISSTFPEFSIKKCLTFLISGIYVYVCTQLCLTLCDPMGCNLAGSFVHGIFQARVLEWGAILARILERVAISFSRRLSWPKNRTRISRFFTTEPPGQAPLGLWNQVYIRRLPCLYLSASQNLRK